MVLGVSVDISDCRKILPLIEKYGHIIKHIQIYLDDSSFDTMYNTIANIIDKRLSYSFHANGDLNMADINQYNTAIQTIDMVSFFHGVFSNFHVGYYDSSKQSRDKALSQVVELTRNLCTYAYQKNVAIHMENDIYSSDGSERLGTILADWIQIHRIKQQNFFMCYDIGHANISFDNAYIYRQYIPKIGSFHIHNNDGINDLHTPFGNSGKINLDKVLLELRQTDKYVILENKFDGYNNALQYLCDIL